MKSLLFSSALLVLAQVFAGEITHLNPFVYNFELSNETYDYSVDYVRITNVPTSVESIDCDGDSSCPAGRYLTTKQVVQFTFSYQERDVFGDSNLPRIEVNYPIEQFDTQTLSQIKTATDYKFDLTGKKTAAVKSLANNLLGFSANKVNKTVSAIDYNKSELCLGEDSFSCTEKIVYKDQIVPVVNLSFVRK